MMFFIFLITALLFSFSCADTEIIYKDSDIFNDADLELADCPDDMVEVGSICIDRYEASREDATAIDQGKATGKAYSVEGVMPWMVNPMTDEAYEEFKSACETAGKRLCNDNEWISACEGPEKLTYSWGNNWERKTCNNVDTFCDQFCEENGIPEATCNLSENCGYEYYCFKVLPTGTFKDCSNFAGSFDINGNVWEITESGSGYKVRGGAFNCGGPTSRLQCSYSAGWKELYAGFRCCMDR
jgi:formylglycine-generating enzyme